ncbi:MAG: hypothetical protein Q4C44_02125 [bacterium]|nr:hypothetical protein [bacterium]
MENNKHKIKLYIGLLLVIILIIGVSYAYFMLRKEQTNDNVIGTRTCLNTTLNEQTSRILLEDAIPISDNDGLNQTPFTFSVTNNCDSYVKLTITIENENRESTSTSLLNDNLIKVNLSPKGTTTGTSKLLGILTLTDIEAGRKGYIISETGLKGGETKEYDLRTWMDSNTTLDEGLGKSWEGKIVIIVNAEEEQPSWEDPGTGTLLAAIKKDNTVTTPLTTPGSETSSSSEAILASTDDDYGTSYYFRGAVENNYVEYANMCWRIVRVTGDGSIKLVLYNYNGLTSTNNTPSSSTPCNVTGNGLAFARYEGDTYTSKFNSSYNDNVYVGFMYGTAGASSYSDAHANTNPSIILTNLNKWYTNVLSKQANFSDNQLADTIWCNDKSVVTDTTFNPGSWTLGTNYDYAKNINYYSATKRFVQASSWEAGGTGPSLICPNDNDGGKLSKFTASDTTYGNGALSGYAKVGLLTADEIAFAGGAYHISNSTYYIKGNTNSSDWWVLSPSGFSDHYARVWGVHGSDSDLENYLVGNDFYGVRPSLSLQSGVKISGGVGSATNPYKIN